MNTCINNLFKVLYDVSILGVINHKQFEENSKNLADQTYKNKIGYTFKLVSVTYFIKMIGIIASKNLFSHSLKFQFVKSWDMQMAFTAIVISPIIEETIFRLVGLNIIKLIQSGLSDIISKNDLEQPVFTWILSSSARVVVIGFAFGVAHCLSVQSLTGEMISRVALLILFPTETIVCESTNSYSIALLAHMMNNSYGILTELALKILFNY